MTAKQIYTLLQSMKRQETAKAGRMVRVKYITYVKVISK
jgi:hypothetical protein